MRKLLGCLLFVVAACGGGSSSTPASTPEGPSSSGGEEVVGEETPATDEMDPELCCCELPADPPEFQMFPTEDCQTDQHGVCVDVDQCGPS